MPDQLALLLREQPFAARRLLARTRRLPTGLPAVWDAHQAGDLDADQVRVIDRIARRVTEPHTLAAIDDQVTAAAQTRSPKQLGAWLVRLVVRLEPLAFAERHRQALADRRVTISQGVDGMGYVTGEISAADAAQIDTLLAATARSLGADDPRSYQQRRADLFTDLLLGHLQLVDHLDDESDADADDETTRASRAARVESAGRVERAGGWLEVEDIDPDTGELLGTHRQPVDATGEPTARPCPTPPPFQPVFQRRPQTVRIGIVVPLSSLLGLSHSPGELADRSAMMPADQIRQLIADTLASTGESADPRDQILFTRLLTDNGGRLLDTTELGRFPSRRLAEAIRLRTGTCCHPTCTVPADPCDIDHHHPHPHGPTAGTNLDPAMPTTPPRQHLRLASRPTRRDGVDWTMPDAERYRCIDEPLPV